MNSNPSKKKLIDRVEKDRYELITFLRGFIKKPSPNPPGDTKETANYICDYLDEKGISYQMLGPDPDKPNIISVINAKNEGRRLVLNGHMDVFPVKSEKGWSHSPWGGELVDGRIYGRGACDMKAGTSALIYTYTVLHDLMDELNGSLVLTVVSDEETGGRLGAGWVVENLPEVIGDCCINAEPSSPYTIRFGEKGILWLKINVSSKGGHGAYPHLSENPVKIAAKIINELEELNEINENYPETLLNVLNEGKEEAERALGQGGSEVMRRVSVNIGTIGGGVKVNVIPQDCSFEVDLRLPPGGSREQVMKRIREILGSYPGTSVEEIRYDGPLWSPPDGEMVEILRENSRMFGIDPKPIISLGGSDLKFWRKLGVPSYYYGPTNNGMGTVDEYVEIDELIHIAKVHLLSAYEYLTR
jgi:succinyl-diaminopimelate desuccinylase